MGSHYRVGALIRFCLLSLLLIGLSGIYSPLFFRLTAYAEPLKLSPHPGPNKTPPSIGKEGSLEVEGISQAVLFRQLQPQLYSKYEEKIKPLSLSLSNAYKYLDSLNKEAPSVQRLAAFSAETSLDWTLLEKNITSEEKLFHSYLLMKEAVEELRSLSSYWVTTDRTRRALRGSLYEEKEDLKIIRLKLEKLHSTLAELQKFDRLQRDLSSFGL